MPKLELEFPTVQHRKGVNIDVMGCIHFADGTTRCTQLDRLAFDMKERKAGRHMDMKEILEGVASGDYYRQGCKNLGYKMSRGKCEAPEREPRKAKRTTRRSPSKRTTKKTTTTRRTRRK